MTPPLDPNFVSPTGPRVTPADRAAAPSEHVRRAAELPAIIGARDAAKRERDISSAARLANWK